LLQGMFGENFEL